MKISLNDTFFIDYSDVENSKKNKRDGIIPSRYFGSKIIILPNKKGGCKKNPWRLKVKITKEVSGLFVGTIIERMYAPLDPRLIEVSEETEGDFFHLTYQLENGKKKTEKIKKTVGYINPKYTSLNLNNVGSLVKAYGGLYIWKSDIVLTEDMLADLDLSIGNTAVLGGIKSMKSFLDSFSGLKDLISKSNVESDFSIRLHEKYILRAENDGFSFLVKHSKSNYIRRTFFFSGDGDLEVLSNLLKTREEYKNNQAPPYWMLGGTKYGGHSE